MFNAVADTGVPGFRVGYPEDEPGFRVGIAHGKSVFAGPSAFPFGAYAPVDVVAPVVDWEGPYSPRGLHADVNCREIIEGCRVRCTDQQYAPGRLLGSDAPSILRRCIRNCAAPSGCSY